MGRIKIVVVILNYNGRQHLQTCLPALFDQTYRNFDVIMVDNGSTDDSVIYIRRNFPQVRIVETGKNYGFSEGNNIGIREAFKNPEVKYIATLNNDTEVEEDWLEQLVKAAESDKKIGACASKLLYFDQRNIIDSAGDFYFEGSLKVHPRGHGKADKYFQQQECLSVCAGAALYRREALEQVKLGQDYFDSDYFAYIEDSDLSLRLRLAGWKIVFVPEAIVYHKVSATISQWKSTFKKYLSARNRIFTAVKIYPLKYWRRAFKNPITYQQSGDWFSSVKVFLKLFLMVSKKTPVMIKKRVIIRKTRKVEDNFVTRWRKNFSSK